MSLLTRKTSLADEIKWLRDNPAFAERPATIREFVGPEYLNCESFMRKSIMDELEAIFGGEVTQNSMSVYSKAMITGGIGIGKTTIASVVLPYLAHWTLCLRDPQGFFNLLPGSRLAFMQMSTSGKQAKEVVFGDIKARIQYSPWFKKYPYDPKFKNQLRFNQKEVWILPGDSGETTFEGYNILGGILDEADSHKVTEHKDYAEQGYTTINSRIESRFAQVQGQDGTVRSYGFLLVIGQMKKGNGFAAKKYREFKADPDAYAARMAIWESFGWDRYLDDNGERDSFFYHTERHEIIPKTVASLVKDVDKDKLIEVPNAFKLSFENSPQKALRDLAGIPPVTGSPFITLVHRITECRERWVTRYNKNNLDMEAIRAPVDPQNRIEKWFRCTDSLPRVAHIDIAYSSEGDGLGLAIGHVPEVVKIEGELKPIIVFDLLMRVKAPAGREIFIGDIRRIIYHIKDDLKFKIRFISTDGFQSTDTRQQFERRRIGTEIISMDRQLGPYEDLREAIYEGRVEFPEYLVNYNDNDTELTEIAIKELMELVDNGKKVDHPDGGSKDVADSMAGVVYTLMGDRSYHRNRKMVRDFDEPTSVETGLSPYGGMQDFGDIKAPLPPAMPYEGLPLP
jgi:hypothetical protein